ncbi:hypothetical protein, partial [Mariniflexile sp. AS56]
IDKTMNDVGKYWKVRNSSSEILKTRKILQRDNKKRYPEIEQHITNYFNILGEKKYPNKDEIMRNKSIVYADLINLLEKNNIEHSVIDLNDNKKESTLWARLKQKLK